MPRAAYVVFNGRIPGIYYSWAECDAQINGFPNQDYRGYDTVAEAEEHWRCYIASLESNTVDVPVYGDMTGKWYAVAKGWEPGIYTDWKACEDQINGFPGAIHRKFSTRKEAVQFVRDNR